MKFLPKLLYQRLLSNIKLSNGRCWIWQNCTTGGNGYSRIMFKGESLYVHIASYKTFVGDIPPGKEIHHKCENKMCINPAHLQLLSTSEHRLKHAPKGDSHYNSKKTSCKHGHLLSGDNLLITSSGSRSCRICTDKSKAKYAQKVKQLNQL